jgi:branched-chain amino acid transport system permease protein
MKAKLAGIVFLALLVLVPVIGNNYILRLGTMMLMYSVLAASWNFIGGMAGYPSFATASFFGLGAYAGALSQVNGVPMFMAWVIGGMVAAVFAWLLGLAILHLRGHYFAIASLIVAEVLREIINSATGITGGGMGLNIPVFRMGVDAQARLFYYSMLVLTLVTLASSAYVRGRPLGFGLKCIKQNEDAALMTGINTTIYKTAAFALSAVFAGCAGAFYASWVNYIDPEDVFEVLISIKPIVMVLLGGAGTLVGPVIGAGLFLFLEELVWRNFLTFHAGLLGLMVVFLVLFLPTGLLSVNYGKVFKRVVR